MDITVQELRQVFEKIMKHLEQQGKKSIQITHDFYWSIPKDRLYDNYEKPTELTVGQLGDDLAELRKIASGESQPLAYGCVWLASVLRAIGDTEIG